MATTRGQQWLWVCGLCVSALAGCSADTAQSSGSARISGAQNGAGFGAAANGAVNPITGATAGVTGLAPNNSTGSPTTLLPPAQDAGADSGGCRKSTIAFVIDGSGSMCDTFGTSTRWGALRTALLDKTKGLMYRINSLASVGMYLYDGSVDLTLASMATGSAAQNPTCAAISLFRRTSTACPQIIEVKPAINNAAHIDQMYPAMELGGSTPTDKVMSHVVDELLMLRAPGASPTDNPQYIILATDGQPNDICTGGAGGDGTAQQQGVVAAVDRAAAAGIQTFVISLASDPTLQMDLDVVAQHGAPTDPTAHTFNPTNSDDLVTTLTKVLSGALGCLF
jgi:hypothetical protein